MRKINPRLLIGILLAAFFALSLIYRIALPHSQVFVNDWIKFTSNDAYYHMRLVDNMVHNFPHLTSFDPYFIYPGGNGVGSIHFFDSFLAVIIWIAGLGSPTQHTVDVIGAYFPAILAALAIIPAYFIGKTLFNRWTGVLAAALVAVLPGEFLGRSIAGFTDHHVAETLFSTTVVCFLIMAIKESSQKHLNFNHLLQGKWSVASRPFIYSLLAGVFMGIYLITWQGAPLFIFIITLYFIVQFIINHLRQNSSEYLGLVGFVLFLTAGIIILPISTTRDSSAAVVVAMLVPLILTVISMLMTRLRLKPVYYPLGLVIVGTVFIAGFYVIQPQTLRTILGIFKGAFVPGGATAATTLEMQPFLSPQGTFSIAVAWGNFTTSFFLTPWWPIPGLAMISFVILAWLAVRRRSEEEPLWLFLIWTLVILVMTLLQRRFAYYLVINIALLSAYLSWQTVWAVGLKKLTAAPQPAPEPARGQGAKAKIKQKRRQENQGITQYHVNVILAIIVVFLFVYLPNVIKSKEVASQVLFAPSNAWMASLDWMRENTPDPFGDPRAYDKLYQTPPPGQEFKYPESAYGVASWWDYGYWISRIAHRLPTTNPSQAAGPITAVAQLFLSQDDTAASEIMRKLESRYIIADYSLVTGKYWAIVTWAGRLQDDFVGIYYYSSGGKLTPVQAYYPDYYRSTLVRLYNFDGKAVTQEKPVVVAFDEKFDSNGNRFRLITGAKEYASYREAQVAVEKEGPTNHVIVGVNPFNSPIALEAMPGYNLVFSSGTGVALPDNTQIPEVKIFEYVK